MRLHVAVALGHTNAEVAGILIVSVRTVQTYRAQVFRQQGTFTNRAREAGGS